MVNISGRQYLPGGGVQQVQIPYQTRPAIPKVTNPTPVPTTPQSPTGPTQLPTYQPGDPGAEAWWNTPEGKAQIAREMPGMRPDAPYSTYEIHDGYYWGVTPSGRQDRLNPSTQRVPIPEAAVHGPGIYEPGREPIKPTVSQQNVFEGSGPGGKPTKAELRLFADVKASQIRAEYNQSIPSWYTQDYREAIGPAPNQYLLASEIFQQSLPSGPSQKYLDLVSQYNRQRFNILSSSGTLVPTERGYQDLITGEFFSQTTLNEKVVFGPATTYILNNMGVVGNKKSSLPGTNAALQLGILNSPFNGAKVIGSNLFGTLTPGVITTAGAIQKSILDLPENVGKFWEDANTKTSEYVKPYIPDTEQQGIREFAKGLTTQMVWSPLGAVFQPGEAIAYISEGINDNKAIQKYIPAPWRDITLPRPSLVLNEYAVGNVQGIRDRPLDAAAMFALTFLLPEATFIGGKVATGSKTLSKLQKIKYTPGLTASKLIGSEPLQVGKALFGTIETYPKSGKFINVPITALESLIGITWGQSIIERVTARPIERISSSSTIIPGSERTWIENGITYTEKVDPQISSTQSSTIDLNPAIPARISYSEKTGRLVWGADILGLPSAETMAGRLGEISGVEILPAIGGFVAGSYFWPRANAWWVTRGATEVNIGPISKTQKPTGVLQKTFFSEETSPIVYNTFKPQKIEIPGGIGYSSELGYPISSKITPLDLQSSFIENTFKPRPSKMQSGISKNVPYVPFRAKLPGETSYGVWSGWEIDPGKVGTRLILQSGQSEMAGMYGASGAEFYFTKVSGQGIKKIKPFSFTLPKVNEPTMIRTTGITDFIEIPKDVRIRAIRIMKNWSRANPGKPIPLEVKKAAYNELNFWAQENLKPGQVALPMMKAEYEGVIPTFISKGQTQLEVTGRNYFARSKGVRVPIVEMKVIEPWNDLTMGPLLSAERVGIGFGVGKRGLGTSSEVNKILSKMSYRDRVATEELFKVAQGIEGMRTPFEKPLNLSKIQSIDPSDVKVIEAALGRYHAQAYGSAIRLGQMPESRILSSYGKMPGDLEVKVNDYVGLSRKVAQGIGGSTKRDPFGIGVFKGGQEVMSSHVLKGTMPENPFGWVPSDYVRIKTPKGEYSYERLNQQVIRYAYGSLAGREVRGQWKWGPKPHRVDKDILGFYSDVQYLLESQPSKAGKVADIAAAMRNIRKHPIVGGSLGKKTFRYGPGKYEYFSGLPLGYEEEGAVGLLNIPGVGIGSLLFNTRGNSVITTTSPHKSITTKNIQPSFASLVGESYKSNLLSVSKVSNKYDWMESKKSSDISKTFSDISGISGGSGRSGISGGSGRSGISGGSGRSGISGGSGRSGISGGSGRSGISGGSGRSGISGGSGGSGISGISGGSSFTKIWSPPKTPPTTPPPFFPPPRKTFILKEEKTPKTKLKLHMDALASKWIIRSPIPRLSSTIGYGTGKQLKDELKIYDKQYSRKKGEMIYVKSEPFEQIGIKVK
ncbi:MAG: hypothetical protein PHS30_04025 [Bacteroidales bacterium]|nr:hypothetical protein [Bacteroidales bacterium]